jgi:hypothetical protein
MSEKITFISGCDSRYYPLLREWLHSLQQFSQSANIEINILDAGLSEEQRQALAPLVHKIYAPDWPCQLPERKTRGREFLKACVCRPFLPQIFPGYDIYVWMDADTWIQDWAGIDLLIEGARRKKITLTGQVDRAYPRVMRIKWLGAWPWKVRGFYFSNARRAFGLKTAKTLLAYHVLLAGTFALHKDAPHWQRWQELLLKALQKGKLFTAEQLCLGILCYIDGFKYEILPAWAHWLCEFKPLWDEKREIFVEPYLPHMPISVLHISGFDEMRLDRSVTTDFKTTGGKTIERSYRNPAFDGESETALSEAA